MILLSIVLCLFANIVRWAELADLTNVLTLKDYFKYNNRVSITYNAVWVLITFIIWLLTTISLTH